MGQHDSFYKSLFTHPRLIQDLFVAYVNEPWVKTIDFSSLEQVNSAFVSEKMDMRESDCIWRVHLFQDTDTADEDTEWMYLYILLEFQSTIDPFMAIRMMTYTGLLYQHLIKQNLFAPETRAVTPENIKTHGRHRRRTIRRKLPPVFPLLLYNGNRRWDAPLDTLDCIQRIEDSQLNKWLPRYNYMLIDEGSYDYATLLDNDEHNIVTALFALEQSSDRQAIYDIIGTVLAATPDSDPQSNSIQNCFKQWVDYILQAITSPDHTPDTYDLQETRIMLIDRIHTWKTEEANAKEKIKIESEARGEAKGEARGEAKFLTRILSNRFGTLPEWALNAIKNADSKTLEKWSERIFNKTLKEILI